MKNVKKAIVLLLIMTFLALPSTTAEASYCSNHSLVSGGTVTLSSSTTSHNFAIKGYIGDSGDYIWLKMSCTVHIVQYGSYVYCSNCNYYTYYPVYSTYTHLNPDCPNY